MKKVFSGLVTHESTCSATIFVKAGGIEDAAEAILDAARSGEGSFELNEGNAVNEYYFGDGNHDIDEFEPIESIDFKSDWMEIDPGYPIYWPEHATQPYTRQRFQTLCFGNDDWAWLLYRACIDHGNWASPETLIDEAGFVESLLFGDQGNYERLNRLMDMPGSCCSVCDGPLLRLADVSSVNGTPENEVIRFAWRDASCQPIGIFLTEGGIAAGHWGNAGEFVCEDSEGDEITLTIYALTAIK